MPRAKNKKEIREIPVEQLIAAMIRYFTKTEKFRGKYMRAQEWLVKNWGVDCEEKIRLEHQHRRANNIPSDPFWVTTAGFITDLQLYFDYWAASLFVSLEGYHEVTTREGALKEPAISKVLNSEFTGELKDYRDLVSHFDGELFSAENQSLLTKPGAMKWMLHLHDAFHEFFNVRVERYYAETGLPDPMEQLRAALAEAAADQQRSS
jgi:hypothetical protein